MLVRRIRKWYEAARFLREHKWLGYAFAILTSIAAMYVRVLLSGVLEGFPFITFFFAIVLTAFIFGWRAGVVAVVLGAVTAGYFLLPPDWSLAGDGVSNWMGMGFYVVLSSVILLLTAAMHRGFAEYAYDDQQRRLLFADHIRSAVHGHRHAGHERQVAVRPHQRTAARNEGALHHRLHAQCRHP